MEIKVPKNKWDLKSVVYSTKIECPRCGLKTYVSLSEWGPKWKAWFEEEKENWTQTSCDRCGEIIVVRREEDDEYTESFKTPIKLGNVYRIKAKDEKSIYNYISYGYIEQYNPFSYFGDVSVPEEWYRIILLTKPTQEDGLIVHCGNFENCVEYFEGGFEILEDTGTPNHYPDVFINEKMTVEAAPTDTDLKEESPYQTLGVPVKPNVWYDVKTLEDLPFEKAVQKVIISKPREDSWICNMTVILGDGWRQTIEHCAHWNICLDVFLKNYEILKVSDRQNYSIKED